MEIHTLSLLLIKLGTCIPLYQTFRNPGFKSPTTDTQCMCTNNLFINTVIIRAKTYSNTELIYTIFYANI